MSNLFILRVVFIFSIIFVNARFLSSQELSELCCPEGYQYDGANCYSGIHIPSEYDPFIYEGALYVKPDCEISTDNECCPPGYTYDGASCYSRIHTPSGYNPWVYDGALYVSSECCYCPEGYQYDGANCYTGLHYPSEYDPFIYEGSLYVEADCEISTDNECCPPGYTYDGANCHSGIKIMSDNDYWFYEGAVYVSPSCAENPTYNICDFLSSGVDGRSDYDEEFLALDQGPTVICMEPFCIPDMIEIEVNGTIVYSSGSLSRRDCDSCPNVPSSCITTTVDCSTEEACFEINYNVGDVLRIIIDGNSCDLDIPTAYNFSCEGIPFLPDSHGEVELRSQKKELIGVQVVNIAGHTIFNGSPSGFINHSFVSGVYIVRSIYHNQTSESRTVFLQGRPGLSFNENGG